MREGSWFAEELYHKEKTLVKPEKESAAKYYRHYKYTNKEG